jgi:hypothetical protein
LSGGDFGQGFATGVMNAGLNHLAQGIIGKLSLIFNGMTLDVIDSKSYEMLYSTEATSGKGKYMNDPTAQNIPNEGPIPSGKYSYKNNNWKSQSKLRQIYNILKKGIGFSGGDWGDYNVPLDVITNNSTRSNFYLHGGFFKGSAGCIDIGANIREIYQLTKFQKITNVYVNY